MSDLSNPYASPSTECVPAQGVAPALAEAESIRQSHLNHEASLKALGWLHLLSGAFVLSLPFIFAIVALSGQAAGQNPALSLPGPFECILLIAIGGIPLTIGWGLMRLASWVRIPAALLYCVGLLSFPIGTLIHAYFLYLVLSRKGGMVLSPEYKRIIEQTPHIRRRTSLLVWILLIVLLVILAASVLSFLLLPRMMPLPPTR